MICITSTYEEAVRHAECMTQITVVVPETPVDQLVGKTWMIRRVVRGVEYDWPMAVEKAWHSERGDGVGLMCDVLIPKWKGGGRTAMHLPYRQSWILDEIADVKDGLL